MNSIRFLSYILIGGLIEGRGQSVGFFSQCRYGLDISIQLQLWLIFANLMFWIIHVWLFVMATDVLRAERKPERRFFFLFFFFKHDSITVKPSTVSSSTCITSNFHPIHLRNDLK